MKTTSPVLYGIIGNRLMETYRVGWVVMHYDWLIVKTRHGYYRLIDLNTGRMTKRHYRNLRAAKKAAGVGK